MLFIVFFLLKAKMPKGDKFPVFVMFCVTCMYLWTIKWLYSIFLILLSGDVEINPGTRCSIEETFSACYWNLSSLSACIYKQLFILRIYIAGYKFNVKLFI